MVRQLWIAGLVLALGASVQAGPLDREHVAEDAKWVLHFDFEAARETTYGERFREERLEDPNVQAGLTWLQERYGIDPREDLHGLTAYGVDYEPYTGTVVLRADLKRDKVLSILREQEGYATTEYRGHTVHTWSAETDQVERRQLAAAFYDDETTVLGGSAEEVQRALDVLDGEAPKLPEDSPLVEEIPEDSLFYGAAVDLGDLEAREGFHVLQQAEKITAAFGERDKKTFLRGRFLAESEDVAEQVKSMIDGLMAVVDLQLQEQPRELREVVRAVKVEIDDQTVKVDWEVETERLVRVAEELERRQRVRRDVPGPAEPAPR